MPETLMEAIAYFSQGDNAHNFMVELRWSSGVKCPRCQSDKVCAIPTRKTWECKCCTEKKQFSVKTGTIFEESPIALSKWLAAIWLIANCKNGVSSYEVHRAIGVTQKTGWFMLHRIRLAMQSGSFEKASGIVESDETYIGGRAINMHPARRMRLFNKESGNVARGKTIVHGLLERSSPDKPSRVKATVIHNAQASTLHPLIVENVTPGTVLHTDTSGANQRLRTGLVQEFIDHAEAYVSGQVHTNGIENFWSLLKRSLKGTYVSVDAEHLFRYLDEQVFRFNERKLTDAARFLRVALQAVGKRLTYEELTGHANNA
jgi:transposase-like protein